jgi:hypothetical protein
MQAVAGFVPKKFEIRCHLKPPLRVDDECFLEVASKPQIRFKGKAQADRESAAYIWVCEHLPEVCNAAIGP